MENFREILKGSGIYRSKLLIDLTDKDKNEMVNKYHIKTVVDLRSKEERERLPDDIVDGVNYVCIPFKYCTILCDFIQFLYLVHVAPYLWL